MTPQLPVELKQFLAAGSPALLLTVDEGGYPHTAFTWARTDDRDRLTFAVDVGSGTERNLAANSTAAIQIIGPGNLVYLLKGRAVCRKARMRARDLALARYELLIEQLRNQAWPGTVVAPFSYQWTGPQCASMQELEQAVLEELRSADD